MSCHIRGVRRSTGVGVTETANGDRVFVHFRITLQSARSRRGVARCGASAGNSHDRHFGHCLGPARQDLHCASYVFATGAPGMPDT